MPLPICFEVRYVHGSYLHYDWDYWLHLCLFSKFKQIVLLCTSKSKTVALVPKPRGNSIILATSETKLPNVFLRRKRTEEPSKAGDDHNSEPRMRNYPIPTDAYAAVTTPWRSACISTIIALGLCAHGPCANQNDDTYLVFSMLLKHIMYRETN